jgi:hypothetical protein
MRIGAIGLVALAALFVAGRSNAGDFVPCQRNTPDDPGLRILVQTVFNNDQNTQTVQRTLGQPLTPVRGSVDDADLLAWCRCVHGRRVAALGEELAVAMASLDPKLSGKYTAWLMALDPQEQREHTSFLFTSDAICVNESQK